MATENLKKVVLLVTKTVSTGEAAFKDGFQWTDIFTFVPELSQIPEIIKNKQALADEVKNLTPADLKDLATYIETNLVLENKKTEDIIESVIEILVSVFALVSKLRPAAPATPVIEPPTE